MKLRPLRLKFKSAAPALLVIAAAGLLVFKPSPLATSAQELQSLADRVLSSCSTKSGSGIQACYNEEIPKLMEHPGITMEDAFQVIKLVQAKDDSYYYCHVASHIIVAKEVDKDPSKWQEMVLRCPFDMCSNGCIHGAFQERFKTDSLNDQQIEAVFPELDQVCESRPGWNPSPIDQDSCYHGLGHTAMYLTGADIDKSAVLCQRLGVKKDGRNFVQTCTEGIFMQLYQPREPEDEALIKNIVPDKTGLTKFCDQFSGGIRDACYREGWVLYKAEVQVPSGAVAYCGYTSDPSANFLCLDKIFQTIMVLGDLDEQKMKSYCQALPSSYESLCFTDTAYRLVTADKTLLNRALSVCQYAESLGVGHDCYQRLSESSTQLNRPGSAEQKDYCAAFPVSWRPSCLK